MKHGFDEFIAVDTYFQDKQRDRDLRPKAQDDAVCVLVNRFSTTPHPLRLKGNKRLDAYAQQLYEAQFDP